jgi:hypothetical protein
LAVSEQAEPSSGEPGSLRISDAADTPTEPAVASATEASHAASDADMTGADKTVSEPNAAEMTAAGATTSEVHGSQTPKAEISAHASEPEVSKPEISHLSGKVQAPGKVEAPGKVIVMSRGDRAWADHGSHAEPEADERQSVFGKRRITAAAVVVALATVAGAVGGALATATFMHGGSDAAGNGNQTLLEASLSRIDADIQSLKSGLDHTSKLGVSQFSKTSDRLDKLERAQAEPAAKLAKLSEAVDRLRAAPAAAPSVASAPAPAAAKETTGSISTVPAAAQQAAAIPVKTEVGRLPTLEDWVLRDVTNGGALIGGHRGVYEVYAGDVVPGLGRVDAIRRQDGRWVVVTSRGLIVAR